MLSSAEAVAADAAGQAPAAVDRHGAALFEPDAPAVEQDRHLVRAPPTCRRRAAERERARVLEEELALLREEEAEAREVDLLLVGLDLGEVGVVGEVGREVLRHAVLHVDADVAGRRRARVRPPAAAWLVALEMAYGLISRFFEPGGASSPMSVRGERRLMQAALPRAFGTGVRNDSSFFHRLVRSALNPQICASRPIAERLERESPSPTSTRLRIARPGRPRPCSSRRSTAAR